MRSPSSSRGSQHDHRYRRHHPEAPADLETVQRGQHQVEHHQLRRLIEGTPQCVRSVGGLLDPVTLSFRYRVTTSRTFESSSTTSTLGAGIPTLP